MADKLSDNLVARIRARLADDWRRTGDGDWERTPPDRRRKHENPSLVGTLLQSFFDSALVNGQPEPLKPLAPLGDKAIAKVEASLGFRLPEALRRLYSDIADGNFGPFFGIRRLSNWAKDYLKLRDELLAERGHEWPANLLPLVYLNGKRICLDRDSGAVVLWNRPSKRCSVKKWNASFIVQSDSLEEWLERWVDTPTHCEGGPEGGWTPPDEELQRRASVEEEKEARKAAAIEKARRIDFADFAPLGEALLERVVERAADPARRTYLAGAMERSQPFDIGKVARDVAENPYIDEEMKRHLGGLAKKVSFFSGLAGMLGVPGLRTLSDGGPGFTMGFEGAGGKLGRPAAKPAFERAEAALGFPLPSPLRQLYELADGGFGPGDDGLLSLAKMVKLYQRYTGAPQGPNDEPWPARLLPIAEADPAVFCFDLSKGSVVIHDVQEMDHLGHGQWQRSFSTAAPSLAAWLEEWLGSATYDDDNTEMMREIKAEMAARPPSPVTGFPMDLAPAEQAEAEIIFLSHGPVSLRADFGLPDTGWEAEVRRRHGLL